MAAGGGVRDGRRQHRQHAQRRRVRQSSTWRTARGWTAPSSPPQVAQWQALADARLVLKPTSHPRLSFVKEATLCPTSAHICAPSSSASPGVVSGGAAGGGGGEEQPVPGPHRGWAVLAPALAELGSGELQTSIRRPQMGLALTSIDHVPLKFEAARPRSHRPSTKDTRRVAPPRRKKPPADRANGAIPRGVDDVALAPSSTQPARLGGGGRAPDEEFEQTLPDAALMAALLEGSLAPHRLEAECGDAARAVALRRTYLEAQAAANARPISRRRPAGVRCGL